MPLAPLASLTPVAPSAPLATARPVEPGSRSFGAVLDARTARRTLAASEGAASRIATVAARGLESIERAQARLDALLDAARSGRTFTAQELLTLQGEAYRYSQAVELSAKLVEQGAQAVKQALHSQV